MKVGLLVGRETSFPDAFMRYAQSSPLGFQVEMIKLGGVRAADPSGYRVIIDRISHEVPFYRSFLKTAVLGGTIVVNNPFWWSADDKFLGTALAARLGVVVPKTVLLPQKSYKEDVWPQSLRNLVYPLDWEGILNYTGLPAIMKPYDGGGWRNVHRVNSLDELIYHYDRTGTLCMMLQELIQFDRYVRCYCIGRKKVLVMPYDPARPYLQNQYFQDERYLDEGLKARVVGDCLKLNEALGYDINTVEFAIRDGFPYAIDFMNPAPDADRDSVGEANQRWFIEAVSEMVAEYARQGQPAHRGLRWSDLLSDPATAAR